MAAKQPDCRQDLQREAVVSTGGRERGREGAREVRHKAVGPDRNAQGVKHRIGARRRARGAAIEGRSKRGRGAGLCLDSKSRG